MSEEFVCWGCEESDMVAVLQPRLVIHISNGPDPERSWLPFDVELLIGTVLQIVGAAIMAGSVVVLLARFAA